VNEYAVIRAHDAFEIVYEVDGYRRRRYAEESNILELIDQRGEYQLIVCFWNGNIIDT
jgi:hypothetical protein